MHMHRKVVSGESQCLGGVKGANLPDAKRKNSGEQEKGTGRDGEGDAQRNTTKPAQTPARQARASSIRMEPLDEGRNKASGANDEDKLTTSGIGEKAGEAHKRIQGGRVEKRKQNPGLNINPITAVTWREKYSKKRNTG